MNLKSTLDRSGAHLDNVGNYNSLSPRGVHEHHLSGHNFK